jgi:cyclophilin family peptidyl-prolyl cis-trans isomerase
MMRALVSFGLFVVLSLGCKGPQVQASDGKAAPSAKPAAAAPAAAAGNPRVVLDTSFGDSEVEFFANKAPNGVKNFLRYANEKLYDGTIFHRVIPNFVVQGGGFDAAMARRKTYEPLQNEADNGLKNEAGTLSWARTPDPHSATNQFYINLKHNVALDHRGKTPQDWGYAVFGKVTKGLEIAQKIAEVPTTRKGGRGDVPVEPIVLRAVRVLGQ